SRTSRPQQDTTTTRAIDHARETDFRHTSLTSNGSYDMVASFMSPELNARNLRDVTAQSRTARWPDMRRSSPLERRLPHRSFRARSFVGCSWCHVVGLVVSPGAAAVPGRDRGADLPRAFRTADLWLIHAADCCSRYSSWTCCG